MLVTIFAGVAMGQGPGDDEVLQMTPKDGGWLVADMVRTVAAYTDQKILYEPEHPAVRGKKISWEGTWEVPPDRLFRWFRAVLSSQRLILVPLGPRESGVWQLAEVNSAQAESHPEYVPESELSDWKDADGCYITTTITVENLTETSRARNALAQMSSRPLGKVNDVPDADAFVIADFAPIVWAMAEHIRKMDAAAAAAKPVPDAGRRREELEQHLVGSRTEKAAEYFIEELRKLDAKAAGDR